MSKLLHLHFKDDKTKGVCECWGLGAWGQSCQLCEGQCGRSKVRKEERSWGVGEPAALTRLTGRHFPNLHLSTWQLAGMHCCSWRSC